MGRRDYLLLTVLVQHGRARSGSCFTEHHGRAIDSARFLKFLAKGKKERICPCGLKPQNYQAVFATKPIDRLHESKPFFCNHRGGRLTRFGARLILMRHAERAARSCPATWQEAHSSHVFAAQHGGSLAQSLELI